jgi:hypothetical protein
VKIKKINLYYWLYVCWLSKLSFRGLIIVIQLYTKCKSKCRFLEDLPCFLLQQRTYFFIWPQICWTHKGSDWVPTLVILKLNRAAYVFSEPKRFVNSCPLSVTSVCFLTLLVNWTELNSLTVSIEFVILISFDCSL